MRAIIVCGTREARAGDWYDAVSGAIGYDGPGLVLIHGACGCEADTYVPTMMKGIDRIAHLHGHGIGATVLPMPAAWKRLGASAGPQRNQMMLQMVLALRACGYAVAVLAFHDDLEHGSRGTKNMVQKARFARVPVSLYTRNGDIIGNDTA